MSSALVVLDIGSTLVDGPARGPGSRLAEKLGLKRPEKKALTEAIMTSRLVDADAAYDLIREHFGRTGEQVRAAVAEIWSAQETDSRPILGVAEALDRLAAHGHRLALLSNIWTPYLRSVRKHFGDFFDAHIPAELQLFSCREGLAKPDPDLFAEVLRRAGAHASDAVMVGDSYDKDIAPAAAAGMRTVWVLREPEREASALVDMINGNLAAPTLTLPSLAGIDPDGTWLPHSEPDSGLARTP